MCERFDAYHGVSSFYLRSPGVLGTKPSTDVGSTRDLNDNVKLVALGRRLGQFLLYGRCI